MNSIEISQVYEQLTIILKSLGLEWISTQVTEHIKAGRIVEKRTTTYKFNKLNQGTNYMLFNGEESTLFFEKGSVATFSDALPYTPAEQLRALITAIEQVVVHTADMEQHVIQHFEKNFEGWTQIFFVPEENANSVVVLKQGTSPRLENSKELKQLLSQLRKEIM